MYCQRTTQLINSQLPTSQTKSKFSQQPVHSKSRAIRHGLSCEQIILSVTADLGVADVFDCVADDADAHVDQIRRRHFKHGLGKLLTVLVDLLQ